MAYFGGSLDRRAILLVAFGFSVALGASTIGIPLVALGAGYDAPTVGFLVAIAAAVPDFARKTMLKCWPLASAGIGIRTISVPAHMLRRQTIGRGRPAT